MREGIEELVVTFPDDHLEGDQIAAIDELHDDYTLLIQEAGREAPSAYPPPTGVVGRDGRD